MKKFVEHLITILAAALIALALIWNAVSDGNWTPIIMTVVALGGGLWVAYKYFHNIRYGTVSALIAVAITALGLLVIWLLAPEHTRLGGVLAVPAIGLLTLFLLRIFNRKTAPRV